MGIEKQKQILKSKGIKFKVNKTMYYTEIEAKDGSKFLFDMDDNFVGGRYADENNKSII